MKKWLTAVLLTLFVLILVVVLYALEHKNPHLGTIKGTSYHQRLPEIPIIKPREIKPEAIQIQHKPDTIVRRQAEKTRIILSVTKEALPRRRERYTVKSIEPNGFVQQEIYTIKAGTIQIDSSRVVIDVKSIRRQKWQNTKQDLKNIGIGVALGITTLLGLRLVL